jgi:hypothetical protein
MRSEISALAIVVLALSLGATATSVAEPKIIRLPAETAALKETSEPGYQSTANGCATCHSVDYIAMQPRGKGKEFWSSEVMKMVNVYGATVGEADRPAIVDYLARNY